jgi:hypothetical protein
VFACCLSLFTFKAFAIEGLHISVPSTNAVLSWPSDPSETYIVQYRQTLSATDSWATLADYYPADSSTNITFFIDPNPVQYGSSSSGGSSFAAMATGGNTMSLARATTESVASVPMAIPADGSGGAVPLVLYPPGFNLSKFLIFDRATGETVNGADYSIQAQSPLGTRVNGLHTMGSGSGGGFSPTPMGGPVPDGGSGGTVQAPETGFYQVVRDGAHLFGLTNGAILSGVVTLPIELANNGGTVSTVSITENDAPIGNSIQVTPNINPLSTTLDTTLLANGVHMISASARWDDTNGGLWEADSPPISVTVSNEISFENWMPSFGETGNTFLFRATSAHASTDWVVYVYNYTNAYLGYFYGHTDDGDISFYYDYSGTSLTNNPKFSFEIATEYVDPPTPPTFKVTDPWSGPGAWVAVEQHAWDSTYDSDMLYGELGGFIGGALGVNWTIMPPPQGQNQYSSYLAYGLTFGADNPQGDTDWQAFRNALYNPASRNLVYFGHGGPNGIGQNPANPNRFITSAEIANQLHTIPAGQANRHAFRFVFLDGCQTAKGNLPEAFGILHRENVDLNDYIAASMRPSAFAGWNATKWITFLDGYYLNYDHVTFISAVQTEMLLGNGIHDAIHNAATGWNVVWSFNWVNQMAVYGFWDLHFGQYNN